MQRLAAAAIPVVVIDAHAPAVEGLPHVVGDDIAGGEAATDAPHRAGAPADRLPRRRVRRSLRFHLEPSSLSRLRASARRVPASRVRPDLVALGAHSRYEARELAAALVSSGQRPTAVFAASDTQALGVVSAAHEAGLRVPDDLSVVGYDDIEIAEYLGLTTDPPATLRIRTGRRADAPLARCSRARHAAAVSSLHPRSWSAAPRLHRRRCKRCPDARPTDATSLDLGGGRNDVRTKRQGSARGRSQRWP